MGKALETAIESVMESRNGRHGDPVRREDDVYLLSGHFALLRTH